MLLGFGITPPSALIRPSISLRQARLIALVPLTCLFFVAVAAAQTGPIGDWVWLNGSNQFNQNPTFGTLQVPSPSSNPGGRTGMTSWTDNAGNLWIFGGGYTAGYNDVWEFNSTTLEWTWMAGPDLPYQPGVYGTLGTPSPTTAPGTRSGAVTWKDADGNFWLFGGEGQDSTGKEGYLNDLWKFSTVTLEWTWMGGSNVLPACPSTNSCGPPGVYGTLGTPSSNNIPPGRSDASGWVDANGDFWLFGGRIYIVYLNGWTGYENDVWRYSPTTNQWTWMGGNSSLPSDCTVLVSCGWGGNYGTLLTPSTSNHPGAREDATSWTDSKGNFWLFGGFGWDSTHTRGDLNDLWEFVPSTGAWEWVSGSATVGATYGGPTGSYGTRGAPSSSNHPGGREFASGWIDQNDNLWVYGGDGYDGSGNFGYLGDFWKFNPSTNQWAWMTGSSAVSSVASYGTFAVAGAGNDPGSRLGAVAWSDQTGNLWIFGGDGPQGSGVYDDAWEYLLNGPPHATPVSFSLAAGSYTGPQSITLSDTQLNTTIYYTTDGSTLTTSSTVYSGAIHVGHSQIISAIAAGSGYAQSPVRAAAYSITPATPVINWTTPAPIYFGTALSSTQLNATTTAPGTLTYNPPAGTVIAAGADTLTASFIPGPDSGYAAASVSVTIIVYPPAARPYFNLAGGTYHTPQSLTLTDATPGAAIYYTYTTNGTVPTTSSTLYTGPITINTTGVVEAIATASLYAPSAVSSKAYVYSVLPPAASPYFDLAGGTYHTPQTLTLTDTTPGAAIFYTTNGTTPTAASTLYTVPLTIASTEIVEAVAIATGYSLSPPAAKSYSYVPFPPASAPSFSLAGGTYSTPQTLILTDATPGATIYYTTNGAAPTTSSTAYTGPITIAATETVKAAAIATGYSLSPVSSKAYTYSPLPLAASPYFSLAGGHYTTPQMLTLTDSTPGAAIYYTTNGTIPTTGSTHYTGPITISTSETVIAIAVASGYTNSNPASKAYTIP